MHDVVFLWLEMLYPNFYLTSLNQLSRGTSESAGAGMVRMSSALECHNAKHNLHGVSLLPGLAPFVIKFASGGFGSHG